MSKAEKEVYYSENECQINPREKGFFMMNTPPNCSGDSFMYMISVDVFRLILIVSVAPIFCYQKDWG